MGYKYSKTSLCRLHSCHPDLQMIFKRVIAIIDNSVLSGHRGRGEQESYFLSGASKEHFPHSKHNSVPSMAIDVLPYPINYKDKKTMVFFAGIVIGVANTLKTQGLISHNVGWGGDWDNDKDLNDRNWDDLAHFWLM